MSETDISDISKTLDGVILAEFRENCPALKNHKVDREMSLEGTTLNFSAEYQKESYKIEILIPKEIIKEAKIEEVKTCLIEVYEEFNKFKKRKDEGTLRLKIDLTLEELKAIEAAFFMQLKKGEYEEIRPILEKVWQKIGESLKVRK